MLSISWFWWIIARIIWPSYVLGTSSILGKGMYLIIHCVTLPVNCKLFEAGVILLQASEDNHLDLKNGLDSGPGLLTQAAGASTGAITQGDLSFLNCYPLVHAKGVLNFPCRYNKKCLRQIFVMILGLHCPCWWPAYWCCNLSSSWCCLLCWIPGQEGRWSHYKCCWLVSSCRGCRSAVFYSPCKRWIFSVSINLVFSQGIN